jgi:hypothetical protein
VADAVGQWEDVPNAASSPSAGQWEDIANPTQQHFSVGDTLKQYWDKINPVTQAQGVASMVEHPIDTVKSYGAQTGQLFEKAKESFQKGNYTEGVRHALSYFLNGIPGLGSALDEAGNKAGSGDVNGAIADTAALATQIAAGKIGPKFLDAATEPGAAANAARAVTEPVKKFAIAHPAITKAAGATAGGAVGYAVPVPGAAAFGGVVGREMASDWLANQVEKASAPPVATPPPPVSAPPVAGVPLPASRQLGAGPIVTPAPADTSGVIPGWKPTILENEAAPAAAAPPAAPAPDLDGVAQGFGFKDFASVKDPRAAATIQRIAAQAAMPNPAKAAFNAARAAAPPPEPPPEAAPPGSPAPTPPPPAAPAAPAAATPPAGAIDAPAKLPPKLITENQLAQYANENGLSIEDADAALSNQNVRVIDRVSLNRTLHAITGDHETLSDIAKSTYKVDSMKKLSDEQMLELVDTLAKEQAAPAPEAESALTSQLRESLAQARARRAAGAKKLGAPAGEHPGKAAFEAARGK